MHVAHSGRSSTARMRAVCGWARRVFRVVGMEAGAVEMAVTTDGAGTGGSSSRASRRSRHKSSLCAPSR